MFEGNLPRKIVYAVQLWVFLLTVTGSRAFAVPLPPRPHYVVQEFDVDPRLATKAVVSLFQDRQGYIWMATQHGLVRTDGAEVDVFGEEHGLPSPDIEQVVQTADGTIWVSTNGGIARFDGRVFHEIEPLTLSRDDTPDDTSQQQFQLQRLAADQLGHLYVATASGVVRLPASEPGKRWTVTGSGLNPIQKIEAITSSADGAIWFVSQETVYRFDTESEALQAAPVPSLEDKTQHHIIALLVDRQGRVWLRTRISLYRRDPGQDSFVEESIDLPEAIGDWGAPQLDAWDGLIMPTTDGLLRKTDRRWEKIDHHSGLRAGEVTAVMEDREGALWLAVAGAGVFRWPGHRRFRGWKVDQGLPDNTVWGMLEDQSGRLWIGTSNGIALWNPAEDRFTNLGVEDGLPGPVVTMLVEDAFGGIWAVSARAGLSRFPPQTLTAEPISMPKGAEGHPVSLAVGESGEIWIGSYEFLAKAWPRQSGPPSIRVIDLPEEIRGCTRAVAAVGNVLWTAGSKGLCRFDGKSWQRYTEADGLRIDYVNQPVPKNEREVWLVYRDSVKAGRFRLEPDGSVRVSHFGREQGMRSDAVFMAGIDGQGNVWLGGDSGITRVAQNELLRTLGRADGLLWDDIDGLGFLHDKDGTIFFGTSGGLANFDPRFDNTVPYKPEVLITGVQLGNETYSTDTNPTVPYEERDLTISFTGLSFQDTSRVRFRYRLVGLEQHYRRTSTREVRYTNLPPGDYRFEVVCVAASREESKQPAVFQFSVKPPWWGTWWFRLGSGLAILLLILGLGRLRTRRLEADRRALEKAVAERSEELARANRELEELSFTDALTRTRNRRYFTHVILDDVARVLRRHSSPDSDDTTRNRSLIFYVIDLDYFKKLNDTCGHLAGDEVLAEVGTRLLSVVRKPDLVVRWGGEEFLIISRDTSPSEGGQLAKRILDKIGSHPFHINSGYQLDRTCSIGWAPFPFAEEDPHALSHERVLDIADRALYLAKKGGRNQAVGVLPDGSTGSERWHKWIESSLDELNDSPVKMVHTKGPERHVRPTPDPKAPV